MTDMDKQVLAFLKEWLAWAEAGGPRHEAFKRDVGLCTNSWSWLMFKFDYSWHEALGIEKHFNEIFVDNFPFGWADYNYREAMNTQHECPKRLAWVRNKIEELENMG